MIFYDGMIKRGKNNYIKFKNDRENSIEIPIDQLTAKLISLYLKKLASYSDSDILQRGNDEISE